MSKLRPILFSTAMVQAILDGSKTQTRRVVKVKGCQPFIPPSNWEKEAVQQWTNDYHPYGQPGDILWVRETWAHYAETWDRAIYFEYKASFRERIDDVILDVPKWKPSIHMPFDAARIFLRVKSIRVERLQDIGRQDALSEGIQNRVNLEDTRHEENYYQYKFGGERYETAVDAFSALWQSIKGPESWDANPWVWVVEFERITREEALNV